ncbi:MAG: hypothetical protein DRO15_01940 [Thermoprotei archaeon]|nr:MAG: hypothetical protein DRO15_01940 [Thermoprotei archaeon]
MGALHIQEHLVKYGFKPKVYGIRFPGIENARATTEVLKAIDKADLIVLGPSNPINSIGPTLNTKNVREKIKEKKDKGTPVIAMAISAKYARRIEDVVNKVLTIAKEYTKIK